MAASATSEPSIQTLRIHVVSCGGMRDLMSDQEASFLASSLGLYRNSPQQGRAMPRANVSVSRAFTKTELLGMTTQTAHVLHVIAHGQGDRIQTGNGKSNTTSADFTLLGQKGGILPQIVVSTACTFYNEHWKAALQACGVKILIASPQEVTPANLVAFDMSFYAALLSSTRRGKSTLARAEESFAMAQVYYESLWPIGTPHAKFQIAHL
ncbi:hypothetical protein [Cellulomonas chitinilytica]|nr:hypothetical protein [Cellulomonas chitinilytica]